MNRVKLETARDYIFTCLHETREKRNQLLALDINANTDELEEQIDIFITIGESITRDLIHIATLEKE